MVIDAIITYFVFWYTLSSYAFFVPEWWGSGGLLNHFSLEIIAIIVVLSFVISRLYSFMEYYSPVDLLKQIVPSFFLSIGGIAILRRRRA